jgi:hypothetical protein
MKAVPCCSQRRVRRKSRSGHLTGQSSALHHRSMKLLQEPHLSELICLHCVARTGAHDGARQLRLDSAGSHASGGCAAATDSSCGGGVNSACPQWQAMPCTRLAAGIVANLPATGRLAPSARHGRQLGRSCLGAKQSGKHSRTITHPSHDRCRGGHPPSRHPATDLQAQMRPRTCCEQSNTLSWAWPPGRLPRRAPPRPPPSPTRARLAVGCDASPVSTPPAALPLSARRCRWLALEASPESPEDAAEAAARAPDGPTGTAAGVAQSPEPAQTVRLPACTGGHAP